LFDEGKVEANTSHANMEKLAALAAISHEWGFKLNQLAISYMLTLPGMGPVIPSSSNVDQLESNAAAGTIVLSEEQRTQIEGILHRN
jgi:aryl-alcohol dehydrogenase-like predicted oxidoreductase